MGKDCILVIAYNRPDYTRQLFDALAAQPSIKNYHVHFQIDPGNAEVQEMCKKFDATDSTVLVNQFRLDCNMNVYAGLKNAFAIADFVMVFEDDCIPAHDCLQWMEWAKTKMDWDAWAINAYHNHEEKENFNLSKKCAHWTAWVWGTSREHWIKLEQIFQDHVPADSSNSWDCVLFDKYFKQGTVIKPYLSRARNIGAENGRYNPSPEWHKANMWIDVWSDSVDKMVLDASKYELSPVYQESPYREVRCFCGGYYNYSIFNGYLKCRDCGTYHSPHHADPKTYYDSKYWSAEKGNSTPIEQWYNLTSSWFKGLKPRVDFWMDIISKITPGVSIEIGPGPGTLMQRMMNHGWNVNAIDADESIVNWAHELSKVEKCFFTVGLWPDAADKFLFLVDMIVCTDVLEHTPDPKGFMKAIYDQLEQGGHAFIQTPVILKGRELDKPFGDLTDNIFEPNQHIYLYSENGFNHLIKDLFDVVDMQVWHEGHECFLLKKK